MKYVLNRKVFIVSITLFTLLSIYVGFFQGFYDFRELLNPNKMEIVSIGNINRDSINVYWGNSNPALAIVKNGKNKRETYKEYGLNFFFVTYSSDTICNFEYFKLNNWHGHKHIITIKEANGDVSADVEIIGPDADNRY